jgi:hypothetical protein
MGLQPTASRTDPLVHCSYAFDPAFKFEREEATEPMRYGSAFHLLIAGLLEKFLKIKDLTMKDLTLSEKKITKATSLFRLPPSSVAPLPGHVKSSYIELHRWLRGRNPWAKDFVDGVSDDHISIEKAFAVYTGRGTPSTIGALGARPIHLPRVEDHVYQDLEISEIAMTVDLELPLLVLDHKTGVERDPEAASHFSEPSENLQMRTQGLAGLARRKKAPILAIGHYDRLGLPKIYADHPSEELLKSHAKSIRFALARIGDGSMRPGPWCAKCPAREACPARYETLISTVSDLIARGGLGEFLAGDDASRSITSSDEIGRLHLLRQKFSALLPIAQKELFAWVKKHGNGAAVRPDGKTLAIVEKTTERISKTSILKALGPVKGARELERLRKLGALKEETHEELHAVND